MLPDTHRNKTKSGIKGAKDFILGLKELEMQLYHLAGGEQVSWFHRRLKGFANPANAVVMEIRATLTLILLPSPLPR